MKRGSVTNRLLDRYVGIPTICAAAWLHKRHACPTLLERIGVMASPTLGDTLLTSAVLQDIRRCYPTARLYYFASAAGVLAAKFLPEVDELVPVNLTRPAEVIWRMRNCKLDVFFDFTPWQRLTAFYTAQSGAKYTVGFRSPNQHRHFRYDLTAVHSRHVHEIENFRNLLRAFGIVPRSAPTLKLPNAHVPAFTQNSSIIVFHAWASGDRGILREWPAERWVELACRLRRREALFVFSGSPSEHWKCEQMCRRFQDAGLNAEPYVSPDGLSSLARVLERAELVVSVNTGIMHLAALLGAPTISLNGPTATHRWGPVGPRVASVEPHEGPRGFLHYGFEFKGNPSDCMQRIRVDDVEQAALSLLAPSIELSRTALALSNSA